MQQHSTQQLELNERSMNQLMQQHSTQQLELNERSKNIFIQGKGRYSISYGQNIKCAGQMRSSSKCLLIYFLFISDDFLLINEQREAVSINNTMSFSSWETQLRPKIVPEEDIVEVVAYDCEPVTQILKTLNGKHCFCRLQTRKGDYYIIQRQAKDYKLLKYQSRNQVTELARVRVNSTMKQLCRFADRTLRENPMYLPDENNCYHFVSQLFKFLGFSTQAREIQQKMEAVVASVLGTIASEVFDESLNVAVEPSAKKRSQGSRQCSRGDWGALAGCYAGMVAGAQVGVIFGPVGVVVGAGVGSVIGSFTGSKIKKLMPWNW